MRVLVCGSRSWSDVRAVEDALRALPPDTVIVHGACGSGADFLADRAARRLGLKVERHPADWRKHGKAAGPIRNAEMIATKPDRVLAFWDGESRGTADTINKAHAAGIPVSVISSFTIDLDGGAGGAGGGR